MVFEEIKEAMLVVDLLVRLGECNKLFKYSHGVCVLLVATAVVGCGLWVVGLGREKLGENSARFGFAGFPILPESESDSTRIGFR